MTRSSFAVLVVGISVGATGCMPMEQAPLVYSSKQQMGVGVAAGTPDSPGLDVNIGYKGLDVAIVPVAFAKRCDLKTAGSCSGINYNIRDIVGQNSTRGLTDINALELDKTRIQLAENTDDLERITQRLRAKEDEIQAVKSSGTDIALIAALTSPEPATGAAPVLTDEKSAQLTSARARQALAANKNEANLQAELGVLNKDKTTTERAADGLRNTIANLLAQRRQTSDDAKKDALSVYGSFGGDANGNADGAGLKLGKVFSTGVAAQNVSQGIRNASKLTAAGVCMMNAKELIKDSTDANVLSNALLACKPAPDMDVYNR